MRQFSASHSRSRERRGGSPSSVIRSRATSAWRSSPDSRTLAIPDRPGNNRIDNLRNIVVDPRVSLLFLVPGVGESLRVNGRARISIDPQLLATFEIDGKRPRSAIVVTVQSAYFHCSKALVRSQLWNPTRHVERAKLPSAGQMHKRQRRQLRRRHL